MLRFSASPLQMTTDTSGLPQRADHFYCMMPDLFFKVEAVTLLTEFVNQHGGIVYVHDLQPLYAENYCLRRFQGQLRQLVSVCDGLQYLHRTSNSHALLYCCGSLILGPELREDHQPQAHCSLHSKRRSGPKRRPRRKLASAPFPAQASTVSPSSWSSRTHQDFATAVMRYKRSFYCRSQLNIPVLTGVGRQFKSHACVDEAFAMKRCIIRTRQNGRAIAMRPACTSIACMAREIPAQPSPP